SPTPETKIGRHISYNDSRLSRGYWFDPGFDITPISLQQNDFLASPLFDQPLLFRYGPLDGGTDSTDPRLYPPLNGAVPPIDPQFGGAFPLPPNGFTLTDAPRYTFDTALVPELQNCPPTIPSACPPDPAVACP